MSDITLGIIGGGQLGSLLSVAANKLNIDKIRNDIILQVIPVKV